jgi:molybdopterin/thiamine biosynthesis adenylyltransferase
VGVAGLSVGSHGAITIALMGGARKIKLADPDIISPTNLNRLRFDFTAIGHNKAELIAQYIYQLNPYSDITVYSEGIKDNNINVFIEGLDIVIEELDDIEVKVRMREEARKRELPVVMATDNGDNVIMDIERFDLHPDAPVFYGKLDGFDFEEMKKSPQKMYEAMAKIIDVSLVPRRILHSIHEVGRTIYSWPQMATAATLSGAVLAYVVRKIALGESLVEGKVEVSLDAALDPNYEEERKAIAQEAKEFLKAISPKP